MANSAFIVGAARSGTTSLVELLNLSRKVNCISEPSPNLNEESRRKYDGNLGPCNELLHKTIGFRIAKSKLKAEFYIEKQVSLVPFITEIFELYGSKFIIPYKDGRDVVTSLINWHQMMFPIIYSECTDSVQYSRRAEEIKKIIKTQDLFDYSLPRPLKNDPYYDEWSNFSRFDMVSWYWGTVYRKIFSQLNKIPAENYHFVDFNNPTVDTIRSLYEFLCIDDFNPSKVERVLSDRVNSLQDRGSNRGDFSYHASWSKSQHERFFDFNIDVMKKLDMYESEVRTEPYDFGSWWKKEEQVEPSWYSDIYLYREQSHNQFMSFIEQSGLIGTLSSVLDIGAGIGYKYKDFFKDIEYVAVDLSDEVVTYASSMNTNSKHRYIAADVLKDTLEEVAEMVVCHATVDNVYDVDAFITRLAKMTSDYLYITSYRGYFRDLSQHHLVRDSKMGVNFNNISPTVVVELLRNLNFKHIEVFPIQTGREDIPVETVIAASKNVQKDNFFKKGHIVYDKYIPYPVSDSDTYNAEAILNIVKNNKASFREINPHLVGDINCFEKIIVTIKKSGMVIGGSEGHISKKANVLLRIDVDTDLEMALAIAEKCKNIGIKAIFYICHTASYYGLFSHGTFCRNNALIPILKQFLNYGQEIGFHVDAYSLYLNHGINGVEAVETEIQWLADSGIPIRSVTGHNAAPFSGAENLEIFKEYALDKQPWTVKNHVYLPKSRLSTVDLGIVFDGSQLMSPLPCCQVNKNEFLGSSPIGYVVQNKNWMKLYLQDGGYCSWGWDYNIWLIGADEWLIASGRDFEVYEHGVSTEKVISFILKLDQKTKISIVVHPLYLEKR